jgi:hypothetical protein
MPKPPPKVDRPSKVTGNKTRPTVLRFTGQDFDRASKPKVDEKKLRGVKWVLDSVDEVGHDGKFLKATFHIDMPPAAVQGNGYESGEVEITITNADNPNPSPQQTAVPSEYV